MVPTLPPIVQVTNLKTHETTNRRSGVSVWSQSVCGLLALGKNWVEDTKRNPMSVDAFSAAEPPLYSEHTCWWGSWSTCPGEHVPTSLCGVVTTSSDRLEGCSQFNSVGLHATLCFWCGECDCQRHQGLEMVRSGTENRFSRFLNNPGTAAEITEPGRTVFPWLEAWKAHLPSAFWYQAYY